MGSNCNESCQYPACHFSRLYFHPAQVFYETRQVLQEFPITTAENVKAPDVVWISDELLAQVREQTASPIAPEICIEVMSPGNTKQQQLYKNDLYLQSGSKEVWICNEKGDIECYDRSGLLPRSALVPQFPIE